MYVIIGGSNGLGLAFAQELSKLNYNLIIYDIIKPSIDIKNCQYKKIDLSKDDISCLQEDISNSNGLIYTAGIGKVKQFNEIDFQEIDRTINVNLNSLIKVITMCSDKLLSNDNFDCMCISSIAGLVSSPLFSVYSASKAGVCKYVEAVNTELIKMNSKNRITNVVATAFKGTGFNGLKTDLKELNNLSLELLDAMNNKEIIHKVNENLINSIIARYNESPSKFSLESYDYKINKGRL